MLKVKVRRIGTAVVGVASLAGAGNAAVGCAAEAVETADRVEATFGTDSATADSALTVAEPGEATLGLDYGYGGSEAYAMQIRTSSTDEYIRSGEVLSFSLPGHMVWRALHPTEYSPDAERVKKATATVSASYHRGSAQVGSASVAIQSWTGDEIWNLEATTGTLEVPAGVDRIQFAVSMEDGDDSSVTGQIAEQEIQAVHLFGADLPNKHVLFDNDGDTLRRRVIEGGNPVRGAHADVTYTDYRADALVDANGLNRGIGKQEGSGRFGPYIYTIYGEVQHEVTVGVYFDDDAGWRQEEPMAVHGDSALLPRGRRAFEKRVAVPLTAKQFSLYFHVKTYLVVDYTRYPNATERWYEQGARILVRERWDNPGGSGTNYDLELEDKDEQSEVKRTIVFIKGETQPGQDMFLRGGLDHEAARNLLGIECVNGDGTPNYACAIPIVHRNHRNATTDAWKLGDGLLDWYGAETAQTAIVSGLRASGSPADWTTNAWPDSFGPLKTVAVDGYGFEPLNQFGMHYWMLDVDMDCSRAYPSADGSRWFEVKSFITNGPGWESDVHQTGVPYVSNNHFAQCGKMSVFERGDSGAQFFDTE